MHDILDVVCIKGKLIDLCCLRIDDEAIKTYTKWMNDETINMWIHHHDCVDQYLAEEEWAKKENKDEKNRWIIVEKETRKMVGSCSCNLRDCITANLGICIGEESGRDKGYGTECIKIMTRFAFNELNAHRVTLGVIAGNKRAVACYKKAGFVEYGQAHECIYYGGHYDDYIYMEILKKDWKE